MSKQGIISYKKAYEACEEALAIKKEATSAELLNWVIANYNIHSLNITSYSADFSNSLQAIPG